MTSEGVCKDYSEVQQLLSNFIETERTYQVSFCFKDCTKCFKFILKMEEWLEIKAMITLLLQKGDESKMGLILDRLEKEV